MLEFLQASPTPFHATANLGALLEDAGFEQLFEQDSWSLEKGKGYFVTRNDSAIVAFRTGNQPLLEGGLALTGAHTDSPCLKVKPNPEIVEHGYVQLGVEVYGGALLGPWFDRDLSLAGRIDYQDADGSIESCLINLERPIAIIPSLAIHLDRGVNDAKKINPQTDLPPILMQVANSNEKSNKKSNEKSNEEKPAAADPFSFYDFLLNTLREEQEFESVTRVLSYELSFYDTQAPALIGLEEEFIASARLDNLLSCYLCCMALIAGDGERATMMVCNDHEEVGSVSSSGAQGPFLRSVIDRMIKQESAEADAFDRLISQSMMLSIDNAHGVHPNYSDRHELKHCPMLNAGPVIKINANQRYASNSNTVALFKSLCESQQVPCQSFVVRSDMGCGSTIGPISAAELGIATIDIGVPTFAMHSIRELAGSDDAADLFRVVTAFYDG